MFAVCNRTTDPNGWLGYDALNRDIIVSAENAPLGRGWLFLLPGHRSELFVNARLNESVHFVEATSQPCGTRRNRSVSAKVLHLHRLCWVRPNDVPELTLVAVSAERDEKEHPQRKYDPTEADTFWNCSLLQTVQRLIHRGFKNQTEMNKTQECPYC